MKKYICVEVKHHKDIAKTIDEYQTKGYHLHTYQATGLPHNQVSHYLLFEEGK